MVLVRKLCLIAILVFVVFPLGICHGEGDSFKERKDIVLTPADQLILDAIGKVNERIDKAAQELNGRIDKVNERIDKAAQELNGRIDKFNERIDNLWITMLGGFLGVMAFIGALVFWDRRTFMKRAREEFRDEETKDRRKVEGIIAAMKKLGEQFPEVQEVLRSFGLL